MKIFNLNLKKLFTFILSISLILNAYSFSFLQGISLAYIFMTIFSLYFIIYILKYNKVIDSLSIKIVFFLLSISILTFACFPERFVLQKNLYVYIFKLLLWGIVFSFPTKEIIDKNFLLKCIIKVSVISTLYLFIQFLMMFLFSIKLPNVFSLGFIVNTGDLSLLNVYRPASFFSEPAYYSTYILITLAILLLENINVKHRNILIFIFAIGIFLSTSTAGIYMLLVLFLFYCFKNRKRKKLILASFIIVPIILIVTINLQEILNCLGDFGHTLATALEKPTHYNTLSRLGGSFNYLNDLSIIDKFIGWGVGNEYIYLGVDSTYINSVVRLIIQFGYIGATAFLIFLLKNLKKCNSLLCLFILILYIIKSFSGGAMFSISGIYMLVLYKCFVSDFNLN